MNAKSANEVAVHPATASPASNISFCTSCSANTIPHKRRASHCPPSGWDHSWYRLRHIWNWVRKFDFWGSSHFPVKYYTRTSHSSPHRSLEIIQSLRIFRSDCSSLRMNKTDLTRCEPCEPRQTNLMTSSLSISSVCTSYHTPRLRG